MPRLPVDGKKVIEHRITFGTKERDMLEGALGGYQFKSVATPVVAGMSDVSFMAVLAGLLAVYYPAIVVPTGKETVTEIIDAITTGIQKSIEMAAEKAGDIPGQVFEAGKEAGSNVAGEFVQGVEDTAETVIGFGDEERGEQRVNWVSELWNRLGVNWRYVR